MSSQPIRILTLAFAGAIAGFTQSPCSEEVARINARLEAEKLSLEETRPLLKSECSAVRQAGLAALAQIADAESTADAAKLIEDREAAVAVRACWALGEIGGSEAGMAASKGLARRYPIAVRVECAKAAARSRDAGRVADLLPLALADDEEEQVRVAALRSLSRLPPAVGMNKLLPLLKSRSTRIREEAAYAVCQLQVKEATPEIVRMLRDPALTETALNAIGMWPGSFVDPTVELVKSRQTTAENRVLGLTILASLPAEKKNTAQVASLMALIDPAEPAEVQLAATRLLSDVPSAGPALLNATTHRKLDPTIRDSLFANGFTTLLTPLSAIDFAYAKRERLVLADTGRNVYYTDIGKYIERSKAQMGVLISEKAAVQQGYHPSKIEVVPGRVYGGWELLRRALVMGTFVLMGALLAVLALPFPSETGVNRFIFLLRFDMLCLLVSIAAIGDWLFRTTTPDLAESVFATGAIGLATGAAGSFLFRWFLDKRTSNTFTGNTPAPQA